MRIETLTCSECGTVVAGNVLEANRVMKCPGLDCENVLRFEDLPADVRKHYEREREQYRMD